MSNAIKAAMLSAIVFPGAGHFFLKKPIPATILAGTAFFGLLYVMTKVMESAQNIVEKIQSGEVSLDLEKIRSLVTQQLSGDGGQQLDAIVTTLIILWFVGIVDSYRVGRNQGEIQSKSKSVSQSKDKNEAQKKDQKRF